MLEREKAVKMAVWNGPRLSLSAAAKSLGVSRVTVYRWVTRGVKGVKLVTGTVGGQMFTTKHLIDKFNEEVSKRRGKPH